MRNLIIGSAVTALAAGSIALAAPASAELAPGFYTYRSVMANGVTTEYPMRVDACGPGCISLYNLSTWRDQGQARIDGTQYVMEQFLLDGAYCADGTPVSVYARYTFNLDGTNGVVDLNGPNPCGTGPVGVTTFTLTPMV